MALPKTKKSGGPKSGAGKAKASLNSIKTGAYALRLVLPGEDPSEFEELLSQFQQDFSPQDVAEAAMVRDLASQTWKQLRVEKMQHTILLNAMNLPVTNIDLSLHAGLSCNERQFEYFYLLEHDDLGEDVKDMNEQVESLNDFLKEPSASGLASLKKEYPDLYDEMKADFDDEFEYNGNYEEQILLTPCKDNYEFFFESFLRHHIDYCVNSKWIHDNSAEINQAIQTVKAQRAMELLRNPFSTRVLEDLQRGFYRTLNELRRHQTWRRSQSVVDVTPQINSISVIKT